MTDTPPSPNPTPPPTPADLRDMLTEMVVKDLLGPAGGPEEELGQREDHVYGRYPRHVPAAAKHGGNPRLEGRPGAPSAVAG